MSDIFSATGEWKEQRYDISDTAGVFGMANAVTCGTSPENAQLELRLAHHFTKMALSVGQANNSQTADNTVIVDIVKNGNKIDSHPVPFDTVQSFNEDITDGNSVKLSFHLDPAKCESGSVTVVVQGLTVS